MTVKELNKHLELSGDETYKNTCYKLKLEIIKRIVTSKAIDDLTKFKMLEQYLKGTATNKTIVDAIRYFQKQY